MHRSRLLLMRAERSFSSGSESKAKVANDVAKYARASLPFIPDDADPIPESYPFTVLHHHKHPELLPPRDPGSMSNFAHHISSSIDAVASLCTAQENRDRFFEMMMNAPSDEDNDGNLENRCIIDTSILGQSELGFMKVLTLYQDLNNPLFRQYPKFDIQDFLSGCGWALEKFHRTNDDFMAKLMNFDKANDINPGYDFYKAALEDPDSPEQTLTSMTTPQGMHNLNMNNIRTVAFDIIRIGEAVGENDIHIKTKNGTDWDFVIGVGKLYEKRGDIGTGLRFLRKDSKVTNVALLSARVEEIYPPVDMSEQIENGDSDSDAPLEDESLRPLREDCDSKAHVVTQLEVLYELQQSFINEDGKTVTAKNLFVGTFEACLNGDGDEDLEWRLASHRPAVEFGAA